jgi:hypothetical protein
VPRLCQLAIALGLMLAFSSLAARAVPLSWQQVSSPEGEFEVSMPGQPSLHVYHDDTLAGQINENAYELEHRTAKGGKESFSADYQDLPQIAFMFSSTRNIFNDAQKEFLKHEDGTITSKQDIELAGHKGREVTFTMPDGRWGRVRMLMVKHRLYMLTGEAPNEPEAAADIERFFSSFHLKPKTAGTHDSKH